MSNAGSDTLIVVVDDDLDHCRLLERWLGREGDYATEVFNDGESCVTALSRLLPSAVCLDLQMPGLSGMETLERIRKVAPQLPVIILTGDEDVAKVVRAMRLGAYDYLVKPIDRTKLLTTIRNAVDKAQMSLRLAQLEREAEGPGYVDLIGDAPAMREVFRQLDRVAPSDVTVLIHGESGTGKELVARAIHAQSGRSDGPFVAINCAAIAESLQESELFGHEKGAFTGAVARRIGVFERAHHGTLLLDEVGELSPSLQSKLLRVLQQRSIQRVGGSDEIPSDFRLLAATHRDLAADVAAKRFRQDLFYRIVVFELELPPLRARRHDIAPLAERFLGRATADGDEPLQLATDALALFQRYDWPGNVRELENVLEHARVLATGGVVRVADLPPRLRDGVADGRTEGEPDGSDMVQQTAGAQTTPVAPPAAPEGAFQSLDQLERAAIETALERTGGNVTEVVRQLGISRTTLYRKLKQYGLR